jgi:glycyl-tRNA synthetase beta subunit
VNVSLLQEEAEKKLYEKYSLTDQELISLIETKNYSEAISKLNDIKPFLDLFFEK